jgi:hypothetical protein
MFQLCFNSNRIHDSVGKALRTANQDHVTVSSHAALIIVFQNMVWKLRKVFVLSFCSRLCSFVHGEHIVFQYNERIIQ